MSRGSEPISRTLLVAGLAAGSTWLSVLGWHPLLAAWGDVALPALGLAVLVAVTGALGRSQRVPALVVGLVQIAACASLLLRGATGSYVPTATHLRAYAETVSGAVASARAYAAPVPPDVPSVAPLLLMAVVAALVSVDLLAGALRKGALAGLVLLGLYALPLGIVGGVSWWVFAAAAAAFLALVFVQHDAVLTRWGTTTRSDDTAGPGGLEVRTGAVRTSALALAAGATALALALPAFVPTFDLAPFGGSRNDDITVADPTVDLRRDLQRGEDVAMVHLTTEDPAPSYLRLAVLRQFRNGTWHPGDREIPVVQRTTGRVPGLDGVDPDLPRTRRDYQVQTTSALDWAWLPAMNLTTEIRAPGDWRFDTSTMDFIAAGADLTAADLSYSMSAVDLRLDPDAMDEAGSGSGSVDAVYTQLPADLPDEVRRVAARITDGAETRFRRAVALQEWFRTTYTYDLSQVESAGGGYADLLAFLDDTGPRRGYCEQFAASMAILARALDIPARMAVGFLQPSRTEDGPWVYSAHDLHAWPELYFPGSGWVRFEPTPGARAAQVPGYTRADLGPDTDSSPVPSVAPETEQQTQRRPEAPDPTRAGGDTGDGPVPWRTVGLVLLLAAFLVAAFLLPGSVRRARRARRLDRGSIETAWQELRDTMVDLGHPWASGRSPRVAGSWVAGHLGAPDADAERPRRGRSEDPEAAAAVERIVGMLERERYAPQPPPVDPAALRADVVCVTASLRRGATPRSRRRARWWPGSVTGSGRRRGSPGPGLPATVHHEEDAGQPGKDLVG